MEFLISAYRIILKISFLIYTLSEAILVNEGKIKKLLKPYRD